MLMTWSPAAITVSVREQQTLSKVVVMTTNILTLAQFVRLWNLMLLSLYEMPRLMWPFVLVVNKSFLQIHHYS